MAPCGRVIALRAGIVRLRSHKGALRAESVYLPLAVSGRTQVDFPLASYLFPHSSMTLKIIERLQTVQTAIERLAGRGAELGHHFGVGAVAAGAGYGGAGIE